jgi:hypothetical protein
MSVFYSSDAIHVSWIRSNVYTHVSPGGQTETICYEKYDFKEGWGNLFELVTVTPSEYQPVIFNDIIIFSNLEKARLTWQENNNAIFVSDLESI